MIFDRFEKGFDAIPYETYQERQPAPDGRHMAEIKKVKPWKGKNGVIVECEIVGENFERLAIFCDGDEMYGYEQAMRILRAVGADKSTPVDDYLAGLRLELVTKQREDRKNPGKMVAGVQGIYPVTEGDPEPAPQPPAAKKPPARTPAQKVAAAAGQPAGNTDDIPF